jgi:hypothetical protein
VAHGPNVRPISCLCQPAEPGALSGLVHRGCDAPARLLSHQSAGQRSGIGPFGEWVDAGVIVLALLKIALAMAFFMAMRPILSRAWRWLCALLIALPGLGNIVSATFTEAPETLVIHSLASAVVVLGCV